MGLIPTLGMGCALQNALAEGELSSLSNWIHLGSLDHPGRVLGRFCTWPGQG